MVLSGTGLVVTVAEEAAQVLAPHHRGLLIVLLASAGTARRLGRKPGSGAASVSDHPLR